MYRLPLLLVLTLRLVAQSADEIAAKSIEAMGGVSRFASIDSIKVQGRMRFGRDGEFTPFSVVARRPSMYRLEMTVGRDHITQAYDGAIGWQSVTGDHKQEPTALTGDSLAHLIDQAANAIGGPLLDRGKRHNQVELIGREPVDGADCYKLKVTLGTGDIMVLFIHPENFREVQEEFPMTVNGRASTIQQSVSEYRRFGPILAACLFVTREKGGADNQRLEIESVELNAVVDPSVFKLPVKQ